MNRRKGLRVIVTCVAMRFILRFILSTCSARVKSAGRAVVEVEVEIATLLVLPYALGGRLEATLCDNKAECNL